MLSLRLVGRSEGVPTYKYDICEEAQKIGKVQIRLKPSHAPNVPADFANNIYYEIEGAYRGKGYGNEALGLALEEAKNWGLREVIITCDETNVPSKKIIEKNGGIFVEKKPLLDGSGKMLKYLIDLKDATPSSRSPRAR